MTLDRNPSPLILLVVFLISSVSLPGQAAEKPNILFLFADDQCFDTIHALGNSEIQTPNLDRLVRNGTTFTHAYNMGGWNGAICVASRMMLISGKWLWHAEADHARTDQLYRQQNRMWPQLLEAVGYETFFTGKWHIRTDATKAFTVARHVRGGMPKQTEAGYNRPIEGQPDRWSPYDKKFGGFWEGGRHWSEVVGDDAIDYLNMAKATDNPFFMYIAFNAPHDPRQSPKEYVDRYPLDRISVPKNFLPEYPFNEAMESGRRLRDERLAPFPRTPYSVRVNRQEYYAIITHMDHQIGRILKALEETGQAENTYIFFTADHGLACGQHGLLGKQNMFDHSVRVPMMVVGPDIPRQKKLDTPVYVQDVMASSLELAEAEKPDYVQFRSLLPLIRGEREASYDAIYGAYVTGQRMVKVGSWKLILYPKAKKALLYNVADDPFEMNDLASKPECQATMKSLFSRLLKLQQETGDKMDLRKPFPDLAA